MQVTVHVFDEIRDRLGRKTLQIELDDPATVGSLLRSLAARIDPLFGELGHTEASTYAIHAILLNGRRLQLERDDHEPVRDGDTLHLIPPITGGAGAGAWSDELSSKGAAEGFAGVVRGNAASDTNPHQGRV